MATKKQPSKKTPAKKAAAKKPTSKKTAAKKPAAKKPSAKKPAASASEPKKKPGRPAKPKVETTSTGTTTSTTIGTQDFHIEFVIPEKEVIVEEISNIIFANDVKKQSIRKKMLAWFTRK